MTTDQRQMQGTIPIQITVVQVDPSPRVVRKKQLHYIKRIVGGGEHKWRLAELIPSH